MMAEIGSISQNETVKCTVPGATGHGDVLDEAEPLERLPETPPFRLHLIRGEDAIGIGADGEEGGIAEVEKPREADHDVEAERQDRIGERVRARVDIALIMIEQREKGADHEEADEKAAASRDAGGAIPDGGEEARSAAHGGGRSGGLGRLKLGLGHCKDRPRIWSGRPAQEDPSA